MIKSPCTSRICVRPVHPPKLGAPTTTSLPDKLTAFGEVTDDKDQVPDADVILVRSKTRCDRDYIDRAKKLQLIIRGGVGLDNIDVDYALSKGIQVFTPAQASPVAVAGLASLWPTAGNWFPGPAAAAPAGANSANDNARSARIR